MIDQQTISVYDGQSEAYRDLIEGKPTDATLLAFVHRFAPGAFILDLGCGPALSSSYMREQGLRVDPVDAAEAMVELANRTFDIGARQAAFEDIDAEHAYDGIWANFSLLHVPPADFTTIVDALYLALKPGGVFHLGMKTGAGTGRDRLGRYYAYYSREELGAILDAAGFEIDAVATGEDRGLSGDVSSWIALTCLAVK